MRSPGANPALRRISRSRIQGPEAFPAQSGGSEAAQSSLCHRRYVRHGPCCAWGEITIAGMREPGPQRSPLGGATWSHQPPFSSNVTITSMSCHCGPLRNCVDDRRDMTVAVRHVSIAGMHVEVALRLVEGDRRQLAVPCVGHELVRLGCAAETAVAQPCWHAAPCREQSWQSSSAVDDGP